MEIFLERDVWEAQVVGMAGDFRMSAEIRLMAEILHQLIGSLSHYL